jgi:hypothetical protein
VSQDARTALERRMWDLIGPPLYYCADCLKGVKVTPVEGTEPIIKRNCDCTGQIMAPRRAVCAGEGGLNFADKAKVTWMQAAASLTGRCV